MLVGMLLLRLLLVVLLSAETLEGTHTHTHDPTYETRGRQARRSQVASDGGQGDDPSQQSRASVAAAAVMHAHAGQAEGCGRADGVGRTRKR